MPQFRSKPREITAWRYEVGQPVPVWVMRKAHWLDGNTGPLTCKTANGLVDAMPGDWVIKGSKLDEVYPCKHEVFIASYDPIEEDRADAPKPQQA